MKKLLSMILAIVMVASLAAVFAVNSNAEESTPSVTVTMGNAYAVAGTEALVDIYVKATGLPAEYEMLRDWQFIFGGDVVCSGNYTVACEPFVAGQTAKDYGFFNEGKNQIGNTCASDAFCTSAAKVTCKGGAYLATVGFTVPDGATGELEVSIANVDVMHFQDTELTQFDVKDVVTVVSGKIVVIDGFGAADANSEEADVYAIPTTNAAGERVTEIARSKAIAGEYGTLIIPASVGTIGTRSLRNAAVEKFVLKNTELTDLGELTETVFNQDSAPTIYYLTRPNGKDTTKAALIAEDYGADATVAPLLQVVGYSQDGNVLTFIGGIAADDTDFYDVAVGIRFIGDGVDRTFCTDTKKICYTVSKSGTIYATTNADTLAAAEGAIDATAFSYISGASVKGIPGGDYTVEVTFYATTDDANGFPIVVCGETVVYEVTV